MRLKRIISIGSLFPIIVTGTAAMAENPFAIPEYSQTITVQFKTAADAEKAQLATCPLPFNKKLAASARWDDSNVKHLDTEKAMSDNGWKGTFYLNSAWRETKEEYCRKLIAKGSSVGVHTVTHPFLPSQNADEQFFEILFNKIQRESDSNSLMNTLAFPFNQYASWSDKDSQKDIGKSMMTAGLIAVPSGYNMNFQIGNDLGYPKGTLAESFLILPGDRDTSVEAGDKYFDNALKNMDKLAVAPCLTVGIHSWHTADGIKNLDALFKKYSNRPDWWYCNQNEYGAYRLEANICKISKKVEGNKAIFTITRLEPAALGASVPLWLKISGADAYTVSGDAVLKKEADGTFLEAAQSSKYSKIPSVIAYVENQDNGNADKAAQKNPEIPALAAGLKADPANGTVELVLRNEGQTTLKDLSILFMAPPAWEKNLVRQELKELAPGKSVTLKSDLGKKASAMRYSTGKAFFAAQIDFSEGDTMKRLYATSRLAPVKATDANPIYGLRLFGPLLEGVDFAKFSLSSESLKNDSLPELKFDADKASPTGVPFGFNTNKMPQGTFYSAAVYDFESSDTSIELKTDKDAQIFANGEKLNPTSPGQWTLKSIPGANRVIAVYTNKEQRMNTRYLLWNGNIKFIK